MGDIEEEEEHENETEEEDYDEKRDYSHHERTSSNATVSIDGSIEGLDDEPKFTLDQLNDGEFDILVKLISNCDYKIEDIEDITGYDLPKRVKWDCMGHAYRNPNLRASLDKSEEFDGDLLESFNARLRNLKPPKYTLIDGLNEQALKMWVFGQNFEDLMNVSMEKNIMKLIRNYWGDYLLELEPYQVWKKFKAVTFLNDNYAAYSHYDENCTLWEDKNDDGYTSESSGCNY